VRESLVVEGGGKRHEVALRRLAGETDLDLGQKEALSGPGELGRGDHRAALDGRALGGEPALLADERGHDLLGEIACALTGHEAVPVVAYYEGDVVCEGFRDRQMPARQLDLAREREPIELIAGQGKQVGQVADRGERAPAEQLDRDMILEL
jgi:hypothetical protein